MYITLAPFSNAFIPSVDASDVLPVEQSPTMNMFCLFNVKSNSLSLDNCHLRPSVILVSSTVSFLVLRNPFIWTKYVIISGGKFSF